jgi:hypothetical protein
MALAVHVDGSDSMHNHEKPEAKYANYFAVGNNAIEFIIEFGQLYTDESTPLLHTRIITSPVYAKDLLHLLQQAIKEHEHQFGPISQR